MMMVVMVVVLVAAVAKRMCRDANILHKFSVAQRTQNLDTTQVGFKMLLERLLRAMPLYSRNCLLYQRSTSRPVCHLLPSTGCWDVPGFSCSVGCSCVLSFFLHGSLQKKAVQTHRKYDFLSIVMNFSSVRPAFFVGCFSFCCRLW